MKICELERKLQEEENQRKLIQDKANQVIRHYCTPYWQVVMFLISERKLSLVLHTVH